MDFQLTEDQRALRGGVRDLLEGRFDVRAALDEGSSLDRGLWKELGDAGFFSLMVPEADGGVGLGLPEAVLVFEEAGRALLTGPLVGTFLAAGSLQGAASGEVVVTCSLGSLVPWLDEADVVLGGGVEGAVPFRSLDPLTPLHRLPGSGGFAHPSRPAGRLPKARAGVGAAAEAVDGDLADLLVAAEQLGSGGKTLEMAVRYARERTQFGRAIGGFQAVKHLCAQMLVRVEVARGAVYAAAVTGDVLEIAGAKLLADEAAVHNARDCLQVHGGMGFTWEADVHLHLKRAWVRAGLGRSAAQAEEELAAAL
ncbi:acyl-CoA/acyl-ACP dehydrogenase [Streptomyces sp. NBC_01381]|uniref:acyl-CoA dehydrogenase family protein n=1 Tax=Streptomyces sp. NBC_01381 TaxID=2903845 RepID=UPI00224CDAB3|nr:acyl-CoA dehydrogenase family protein [Streptomyces sp. NBC_01381]MCX4666309.1 acyl-CoA/acyl-ACP dehydrogenase [Streptomyces sp. NBC_01381]